MAKRTKKSITLDPEILDQAIMYAKVHNIRSLSMVIEKALSMFLNQDEQVLSRQIANAITSSIKTFEDRYCRILAKNCKTTYAEFYLLLNMLAYMSNNENDSNFIKEALENANRKGYEALKNGLIERDIEVLFPKEELNKKFKKD